MSGSDWIVIAASIAAIIWVNWYFFIAERTATGSDARERPKAGD
jgi:hypothetical protein